MASEHHTDLPAGKIPQMRVVPMPNDANMHGDVFGGWIMSQVDLAGAVCATRRANGRVVTNSALESKLYSWDEEIASNSIQVHISNLRKKLGKERIKTLVGIGYCIE